MQKISWGNYPLSSAITAAMPAPAHLAWEFERDNQLLRLETHMYPQHQDFVIVRTYSGRLPLVEHHHRYPAFLARALVIDQALSDCCWSQVGQPDVVES